MLSSALAVLLGASIALAFPSSGIIQAVDGSTVIPRNCGTVISDKDLTAAEEHFAANKTSASRSAGSATINVYFHVISQDGTPAGGDLSDQQIDEQITVLNNDFRPSGLSFVLIDTDRTVNADWFNNAEPDTQQQTAMKNALRKGGAADLNLYSVGFGSDTDGSTSAPSSGKGLLGYATFPWFYNNDPNDDGVVFLYSTVPNGGQQDYQMGKTVTHEVGHWVGLYHTFQGGCATPGDFVDDTAAEDSPAYGCPIGRDTCPAPGQDPIHNFMDYTVDACMFQFTPGQISRFQDQLATYRSVAF